MKTVWKSKIQIDKNMYLHTHNFYEKLFSFGADDNQLVCFYWAMDTSSKPPYDLYINAAVFQKDSGALRQFNYKLKKHAAIPHFWEITENGSTIKLDTGRYAPLGERRGLVLLSFCENGFSLLPDEAPSRGNKVYNDQKEYVFGNLKIAIAKNATRKLQCVNTQTNQVLWTFKFVGYLYTEIKELNGIVYFGTAGQGGHFYGLDIESGVPLHDVNTHGTTVFSIYENKILLPSQYGDLLMYSPDERTFEEVNVGQNCYINDEVNFSIEGDKLYTIIAENTGAEGRGNYYAACVDLKG